MTIALTEMYFCWLIFMLCLRPEQGRAFIGYLDSFLNKPLTKEMHTYEENCDMTWENFADNFDHYYLVHLCNWFLASFVIRDYYILHFWQILDELVELSL